MTNAKRTEAKRQVVVKDDNKQNPLGLSIHLYCYLRVSTQSQIDDGSSLDNQKATGKRVAKRMGLKYVEMNEGACSSKATVFRPVYEDMKKRIMDGEIKHIWVMNRNRWNRDMMEDMMTRNHYFIPNKVKMYEDESGQERLYAEPQEQLIDTIITGFGQYIRDNTRKLSISGKKHLSIADGKSGVFMGGTINYGYKNVDKKWTIEDGEAAIVKNVFEMYATGNSLKELKTHLDSNGIKPRRSKLWSMGTIHTMLKNRVYVGEYVWLDKESGKKHPIVTPQIITHSLFNRVQKRLEKNTRNHGNNRRQYTSLLSDFMVCSCGEKIGCIIRQTVNKKVYGCSSKHNKWKGKNVELCYNRRGMNMDLTDEFVVNQIKDVVGNSSILKDRFKKDVLSQKSIDSSQIDIEKQMRENKIQTLDKQIEITVKSISANEVNHMLMKTEDAIYEEINKTLVIEKDKLEKSKTQYIGEINELDNRKDWINWITQYGDDLSKKFDTPTTELLSGMIKSIEVQPTFGLNRDEIEKQVGHKLMINFNQPIVDDSIEYLTDKKSDGYNVVNGKKKLDIGILEVQKGGRGNTAKKNHRI
jgi:site-specific DNA recombinase